MFLLLLAISVQSELISERNSKNYHVSASGGNDEADGLSEYTAWKSLKNLKNISLEAGDSLLFQRGESFYCVLELSAHGTSKSPVVVSSYGKGEKPIIVAPDSSLYTILIRNSSFLSVQNLEIVNKGTTRIPNRTGVKVLCEEYGASKCIKLQKLDIRDVNGSLVKKDGGGSGILIENKWKEVESFYDSLLIEDCTIRRCERNAMIWHAPWSRNQKWVPSINTVVRRNLIEEVPGDGIVPIGCDGAIIEYNLMRNCPATLPDTEAAAGIWPWSCDNTVIQFNEVSDHKAPWDAQGFDADYNCQNTTIRYNYSHDNDGGFLLVCDAGTEMSSKDNIGNIGTKAYGNLSVNDAIRTRMTRSGIFSPTIHIAGPVKNTSITNNILFVGEKPDNFEVDKSIINSDNWGGYADNTLFKENVFYVMEPSTIKLSKSTNNQFEGNYYLGTFINLPDDSKGRNRSLFFSSYTKRDEKRIIGLLLKDTVIGDGAASLKTIDKDKIESFFYKMKIKQ